MRTLMRWFGVALTLLLVRALLALALVASVILLTDAGLQALGVPSPSLHDIAQRLGAAHAGSAPPLTRIRIVTEQPRKTNSAPARGLASTRS